MPTRPTQKVWQLLGLSIFAILAISYYQEHHRPTELATQPTELAAKLETVWLDYSWYGGCYDGDTCQFRRANDSVVRVRFARIDTPERDGHCRHLADQAAYLTLTLLTKAHRIEIRPIRTGHYGRLIAEVYFTNHSETQANLSNYLLEQGLASPYGESTCPSAGLPTSGPYQE